MNTKSAVLDLTISRWKRDERGNIELTEPELLYQNTESAKHYLRAMRNTQYSGGFHADAIELVKTVLPRFYAHPHIRLFDLGPGYPDKTLPIMTGAKDAGVTLDYFPVDISEMYLEVAAMAAEEHLPENQIFPLHTRFEEMAGYDIPNPDSAPNFYFLGLTAMNYASRDTAHLLASMMKNPGDTAVIIYETITRDNPIEKIVKQYQTEEAREFTFGPLKNIGFHMEQADYSAKFNKGRIECAHTFKGDVNDDLIVGDVIFFRPGQKATTAVSYRKTAANWRRSLKHHFEDVTTVTADSGSTVLAFLQKPKFTPQLIVPHHNHL